ncbi:MAG TPA: methyltransferase domain-containing protein [Bacillota bacterium]
MAGTLAGAAEVIGLDFSPRMIEVATAKAERTGLSNVRFIRGDASNPGLTDFCDLATAQNAPLYLD